MRKSFLRLILGSVLFCWVASFATMVTYSRRVSWLESKASTDGVAFAYQLLEKEEPEQREQRLQALRPHYWIPMELVSFGEVQERTGKTPTPGEHIPLRASAREEWLFIGFEDGAHALAIGPVDPVDLRGNIPIGVVLIIFILPILAGIFAFVMERSFRKVERASDAIAGGDLSARLEPEGGATSELADRFNTMAERIERLVKSRDELVQAVSHELGSPLSRLRFHMALLEDEPSEKHEERLRVMNHELDMLDELVAELLGYVQSDELALDLTAFDPARALTDLAELAVLDAHEDRGIEVKLDLQEDVIVYADPRHFQRAIENLLRNATRYASAQVLIELSRDGTNLHVTIHDDGPGIPEEFWEKVMLPFVRLEADRGRKTGGVGLGLAIVGRILQRHGGSVTIGTSPLGGAAFRTSWPQRDT